MSLRPLLPNAFWLALAALPLSTSLTAQVQGAPDTESIERLRRDQDELLRKAERLRDLMTRLVTRYEAEKKPEQVKLLRDGLSHLERSGILRDVASIRDDLAATAFTEAVRKQKDVVDDLERLLNILLERKSIENLDKDLKQAAEQAKSARELEQRQRELIERTREASRAEPSAGEQQVRDQLQGLRDAERREGERNARQAGTRRPFLENALERVKELLQNQQRLEQGLADEAAGRTAAAKAREFDLGDLVERTRELQGDLRDQAKTQALREASRDLQKEAAGADATALQQSRDRLESQLAQAPRRKVADGKAKDPAWTELKEQLQKAGAGGTPAEREALQQVAERGQQLAEQRDREATNDANKAAAQLQQAADKLAERMRQQAPAAGTKPEADPANAVAEARQRLGEAAEAEQANDVATAQKKVNEALAALDRARSLHQQQNPDATKQASSMAAESGATAQDLQNAPNAEQAEQDAGKQLAQAEKALRDVEAAGEKEPGAPEREQRPQGAAQARKNLEAAKQTLEQALQGASQDSKADMQEAAARQQQLEQQAAQAAEQLQQAARSGAVDQKQAEKAGERVQQAKQRMQKAAEKLQSGQQASAAQEQQAAGESLQQAMDALEQNRPTTEAQKQKLQEEAKAQQKLAEDIIRLTEELKKRDNKNAERKAQQAADAAQKAQQAMERGEPDQADQQQEEARKNLEDAAKELEQEAERYQDLRQEELLFRMKDELQQFLERQRPISSQTQEAQKSQTADGLSRAMRTKVNQLGEEEQELAGKIASLVTALTEEGNLVYRTVLMANIDDLREVARRLGGRRPDVGTFTTLMQQDVETRTVDLLAALERERQRREQQRKEQQEQQQQQQDRGKNKFNPQRQQLVSLIAELEMLKKLGTDTRTTTDNLKALIDARGDDNISEAEASLVERLANRHAEITKLFQQIKAGVEKTLEQMQGQEGGSGR